MPRENALYNTVAPLSNVAAMLELIDRVQNRSPSLPGMACYYGPSGYGKSTAATYAENKFQAVRVQMKSTWTPRKLCQVILQEMGQRPVKTVCDMVEQICEQLAVLDVPLLIDEADCLVKHKMVELARDMHEGSGAPVILIGEERLPQKLTKWERVHGRMLDWTAAQPGTLADLVHLAGIYAPNVTLGDAIKKAIDEASRGSIRRICTNLEQVAEFAATRGLQEVDLDHWKGRNFFEGIAPQPRRFEAQTAV